MTNLRIRGVEFPGQSEDVKKKMMQTCLIKYGVNYSFQAESVKAKIQNTC